MDLKETILESLDDLIQEVTEGYDKEDIYRGLSNLRKDINDCLRTYEDARDDDCLGDEYSEATQGLYIPQDG